MIQDIDKYLEDKNHNEQYDYKILLYGNYTFRQNLEADSLVEVLRHTLPYMSKRWKIHFTLLIPELVGSLNEKYGIGTVDINTGEFVPEN